MKPVFAVSTTSVTTPLGGQILLTEGSHWSSEDPLVRLYPDLFSDDCRYGMSFSRPLTDDEYPGVEQATATPGERRNVRRG